MAGGTDEWIDNFDRAWAVMANNGQCDGLGGMEYRRVRREWEEAGRPRDIRGFILQHANRTS